MTRTVIRLQSFLRSRLDAARADDRGALSSEGAIIAAALAVGAVSVTAIIVARATGAAESIPVIGG